MFLLLHTLCSSYWIAHFLSVLMLSKFFDAHNVGDFMSSKHHRKPFKAPFYKDDFRLDVSDKNTQFTFLKSTFLIISGYRLSWLPCGMASKCNDQERI